MPAREDEILALRSGKSMPPDRIISLRSAGMHAIRLEFILRLLRSRVQTNTMQIYWEGAKQMLVKEEVTDEPRRLILGWRRRVTGEFPDLWLLCYPEDEDIKELVEHEIDRMVEQACKDAAR